MTISRAKRVAGSYKPSSLLERRYERLVLSLITALQREITKLVMPEVERFFRADALPPNFREPFGILEIRFNGILKDEAITESLAKVGKVLVRNNGRTLSRVLNIELDSIGINDELLTEFVSNGTALIKSLGGEQINRVQQLIESAAARGERNELVAKQMQQEFGIAKSRAKLIARDQLGKFNGKVTKARHKIAGVDSYIWTTAGDERVRDTHYELDGTTQRWDSPPIVNELGDQAHPGEDIQCRCFAYPIL